MNKLSIITINFNNSEGLKKTINSIKCQSSKDFEYLVIDGGSSDNSVEVIRENSSIVDYWISEKDNGVYHAMNKGVKVATGDYCIFMNSGDVFYDEKVIEHVIPSLDNTDVIVGSTWLSFGRLVVAPRDVPMRYFYNETLQHQSSFIKRELLLKYPYDETLHYVSDWKFWIQTLVFADYTYKPLDFLISIYDFSGMSTINYKSCAAEKNQELNKFFPTKVLRDYEKLVVGDDWEDKLYLKMKGSDYHRIFYIYNVIILKFFSLFKKSAHWIYEFPIYKNK